jgi:hypothetical protein
MVKISRFTLGALLSIAIGVFVGAVTLSLRSSSAAWAQLTQGNEPDFPKMDPKPSPTTETFQGCPPEGQDSGDKFHPFDPVLNKLKNRIDEPQKPFNVTIDQILSLPKIAADKLKEPRAKWSPTTLAEVRRFEGIPVTVEGFLAGVLEEGKESCNCGATSPARVDWHCWLTKSAPQMVKDMHHGVEPTGDELASAVVCETTPRVRALAKHKNWNLQEFENIVREKKRVRLTGWIMFDQFHSDQLPSAKKPRRGTLWEVHPITKVEVQENNNWRDLDH